MLGRCTLWKGGVLCGRAVYCVLEWCTVCSGGVYGVRAMYYVLGLCTPPPTPFSISP